LKLRLVSEAASVAPGRQTSIGLDFTLDPGWHIYWVNAGDSGQPPRVRWTTAPGATVGALQWPQPMRIVDSAKVVDYGYMKHVLLIAPIRAPASVRAGTSVEIGADVSWLVCRDVCVPGKASVSLTIPVAARGALGSEHPRFDTARREIPKALPAGWKANARSAGGDFVITIETGRREATATFFPLDDLIENAADQRVEPFAHGIRLTVKKVEGLTETPRTLRGVVALGPNSSFVTDIPVGR
jgi:thiol:disulfide interchange protein DsbD